MALKILMFGWEFPPFNSGGLGTACLGLTKALGNKGVEIIFVLPHQMNVDSQKTKFLFADSQQFKLKIEPVVLDSSLSPYLSAKEYEEKYLLSKQKGVYGRNIFEETMRYGLEAAGIASSVSFDIIHAHDWMSFSAGIEAKKISGKPLVVHVHSTVIDRTGGDKDSNSEIFKIEKAGMEAADKIITVSEYTKKIIIDSYGIPGEKIDVIYNGIDLNNDYKSQAKEPVIHALKDSGYKIVLFVGRLTIQKGADYFLKAAKLVIQYYPKALFVIVGSGDMEYQLISQAATLGISDKVLFTGFLRGDELSKIYSMADLFVMPSVSEPFGITALEAVIHDTPVIVSKQSGVREVLQHALTVDFWDIEEMTNKILAVLNYGSLQLTLKQNAYSQIKQINWSQVADRCMKVYKQILNNYF